MKFRSKLVVAVAAVALTPLVVLGLTTQEIHQEAIEEQLAELHGRVAESVGVKVETTMETSMENLANLVGSRIHWPGLGEEELTNVSWLVFDQDDDLAVVTVLDHSGAGQGPSVYRTIDSTSESVAAHPVASNEFLRAFSKKIPFQEAQETGLAIGAPFVVPGVGEAFLPIGFRVPGTEQGNWVIAVALSLRSLCQGVREVESERTSVRLLAGKGVPESLCGRTLLINRVPEGNSEEPVTLKYRGEDGGEYFAAIAPAWREWHVAVSEPASVTFAPSRKMRTQGLIWLSVAGLGALLAGWLLSRVVGRPLTSLAEGAQRVAAGDYEVVIPVKGRDEFAEVSTAFNAMSQEIKRWHEELNLRVDERTRDLEAVQKQLVASKKMAAMASLSAGIAHEINNPLTAVLAMTQVLVARARKDATKARDQKALEKIESASLRIRDIVQRMQRLSEDRSKGRRDVDIHELVRAGMQPYEDRVVDQRIELSHDLAKGLPRVYGNSADLAGCLGHLFDNAIKALADRDVRKLSVLVSTSGDQLVRIQVADTGKGIAPEHIDKVFEPFFTTKDHWQGQGLGLAEAHQVIEDHHGSIRVESSVGHGTTFTILLPVSTTRAHLV